MNPNIESSPRGYWIYSQPSPRIIRPATDKQTQDAKPLLFRCGASVIHRGTTFKQKWFNVLCLQVQRLRGKYTILLLRDQNCCKFSLSFNTKHSLHLIATSDIQPTQK